MANPTQRQATWAVFVTALLLGAPAHAALIVDAEGKPVRHERDPPRVIGKAHEGACKPPRGKRAVVFNLARETKLVDAVAWISPIICKSFVVRESTLAEAAPLTMVAPKRIAPKEAHRLFMGALDSVGLTVEQSGKFLRIVKATTVVTPTAVQEPKEDGERERRKK
jgi:hypothetical protein